MADNKVIIITGVSGTGKTTVGLALAERCGIPFYDGDGFHPQANIAKMSAGIPLDDEDRLPWLRAINEHIREKLRSGSLIIACSALREKYRSLISEGIAPSSVIWVHLVGDYDVIYRRMSARKGHFMNAGMLRSQFASYEAPVEGIVVNVDQGQEQVIHQITSNIEFQRSGC